MLIEAITTLGGLMFGGVSAVAPEVVKLIDRKDERKHELSMLEKQMQLDELRLKQQQAQAEAQIEVADMSALTAAIQAQAKPSGTKWIDGVNALVRPFLTFWWCVVLATAVFVARFIIAVDGGLPPAEALVAIWGTFENTVVAAIIGFWFPSRAMRKGWQK